MSLLLNAKDLCHTWLIFDTSFCFACCQSRCQRLTSMACFPCVNYLTMYPRVKNSRESLWSYFSFSGWGKRNYWNYWTNIFFSFKFFQAFKNYVHEFMLKISFANWGRLPVYIEAHLILKRIKKPSENCNSLKPLSLSRTLF